MSSAVLLLALAGITGCGGSTGPAAVVRQAVGSKSASRCQLYTDAFFEQQAGTSAAAGRRYCRQLAATTPAVRVNVVRAIVHDGGARVTAEAAGRTVNYRLVREHGRWLIDALTSP